jgi:hypothetical protein
MAKEPKVRVKLEEGEEPVATWVGLLMTSLTTPMMLGDEMMLNKAHVLWSAPLSEIRSVEPYDGKRSYQIEVGTADGESRRVMIQHRRRSTIMSKENEPVRNEAVEQIRAALG